MRDAPDTLRIWPSNSRGAVGLLQPRSHEDTSARADGLACAAGAASRTSRAVHMRARRNIASPKRASARRVAANARAGAQVIWYSGPSPPSGGVRRPPLAVIAPHCTQFDGLTIRSTGPLSGASSGTS